MQDSFDTVASMGRKISAQIKADEQNAASFSDGMAFLKNTKPADWLYRKLLVRGFLYTLTSPTNHGKTTLISTLICAAVSGNDFCGFQNKAGTPLTVLYLCGENDADAGAKLYAAKNFYHVKNDDIAKHLVVLPLSFNMAENVDAKAEAANTLRDHYDLVIVDTWQAYWSGGDFNNNDAQLAHAFAMRQLTRKLNGNPTVIVPAHPVKNATKDNLVPYGGGAAMNEIDTNITAWNDSGIIEVGLGKKRQTAIDPFFLELVGVTVPELVDSDGLATESVVAVHASEAKAERHQLDTLEAADAVLLAIYDEPSRLSIAALAARIGKTNKIARTARDKLAHAGLYNRETGDLTVQGKSRAKSLGAR